MHLKKQAREKQFKEKPAYNIWQNTVYIISNAWARDKSVILVILAQIVLSVAASTVAIYLPKTVVALITSGAQVQTLITAVLAFTVITVLIQAVKNFYDSSVQPKRVLLRLGICHDIMSKAINTDYMNLENKKFTDAKQKAHNAVNNNLASTEMVYTCLSNLGINILGFIIYTALLVSVNPIVLAVTAATTILNVLARRRANKWQHDHDSEPASYNKRLWYLQSIGYNYEMSKDIRLFAMAGWLKDVYEACMNLAFGFYSKVQRKQFAADIVDCLAAFMREGIAYAYLIWQVLYFKMPVDEFVLLFAAIGGFSGWIAGVLNEYSALAIHSLNYSRLREYLEFPDCFKTNGGKVILQDIEKSYTLEIRNMSFRYSGVDEYALENINLTISSGEKLAVVGLNGAGKTTLVKLLCGLYDPTSGQVLLNGTDIREFDRKQYYSIFTAVFQEFNILPMSIAENVSQHTGDGIDRGKLQKCLELADISQKIGSFPDNADSLLLKSVNEDAVELSGGETQKLMLARALYKDSPILLLDEPTASLDPIAESRLYGRYHELSEGKTSVYISHRLASTRFCDRIILIHNKTIAECGTHYELVKSGGKYAELFEIQSKYYKDDWGGETV